MLTAKKKQQIEKVCNRIRNRYGVEAAITNVLLNLQTGECSLAEYQYARTYVNNWSVEE